MVRAFFSAFVVATVVSSAWSGPAQAPSAREVNAGLRTGFNLGNTFDLGINSTKLKDIAPLLDLYSAAGMRHVRIPVTWGNEVKGDRLMDRSGHINLAHPRLRELDQVVDYALKKGLYVIVNTHHEHWLKEKYDGSAKFNDAFSNLWKDIAKHYKTRSPKLIFEILNEPEGAFGGWSGPIKPFDPQAIAFTRKINEIGWAAVRSVSPTRVVMIGTNGQGNFSMLDDDYPTAASLPGGGRDRYLMATVHTYDPWQFCGQDGKNANWPGAESIIASIKFVASHASKLGIPVNFGEFGVGRSGSQADRDTALVRGYYRLVRQTTESLGMSCTPWDDQGWFGLVARDGSGGYRFQYGIVPSMMRK